MFPTVYLLLVLTQASPGVEIAVSSSAQSLALSWSDAEDRLQGMISPQAPVAGAPLQIAVHLGSYQGPPFDGPVTFGFKSAASKGGGASQTVKRAAGEKTWRAQFVPEEAGPHILEISFTTTRMKVASTRVEVMEARLPRWPWWVVVGVAGAVALGLGVRSVFKNQENT